MLKINIPETEFWDEKKQEFVNVKATTLNLEHSLVSISKWESKWCTHFLNNPKKTNEQIIDYFRCMTLTQNVDPNVYLAIPSSELQKINDYIESPMTATTISEREGRGRGASREIITSELIYYLMISYGIPFECQKWHINRLLMLIRVCEAKNGKQKKMSKSEVLRQNRALNEARKKKYHTKG